MVQCWGGDSWSEENSLAEEFESRAAGHLPLEHLDPVDMALHDARVPGEGETGPQEVGLGRTSATKPRLQVLRSGQGRVRMRGPSSVTAMVCSMWAARLPSVVRRVQPSSAV